MKEGKMEGGMKERKIMDGWMEAREKIKSGCGKKERKYRI